MLDLIAPLSLSQYTHSHYLSLSRSQLKSYASIVSAARRFETFQKLNFKFSKLSKSFVKNLTYNFKARQSKPGQVRIFIFHLTVNGDNSIDDL